MIESGKLCLNLYKNVQSKAENQVDLKSNGGFPFPSYQLPLGQYLGRQAPEAVQLASSKKGSKLEMKPGQNE
jgi:hypothetical protein